MKKKPTPRTHTRSSETQRKIVEAVRNEKRLQDWRARYTLATGREPVRVLNPPINPAHRVALARAQAVATGNSNVVKMRAYKKQYKAGTLPTTPDSAA